VISFGDDYFGDGDKV